MRIAIVSDTHSRTAHVAKALKLIAERDAEWILHCGDLEDAPTVRLFPAHTHFVFGNCDADREGIRQAVRDIGATLHEPFGHLTLEGKTLAFVHGDDHRLLRDLANAGAFDYLFHGHTHVARDEQSSTTRIINPGALHRANPKRFAVLDLKTGKLESLTVE